MTQTIKCPRCKEKQPKQPICERCGFDIRAYALSKRKAHQQTYITCPNCEMSVPKQPICSACGFDIRAFALSQQRPKEQSLSPASGGEIPPEVNPAPSDIAPLGDLFSRSWEVFKKRWGTLLGLYLIGLLFATGFFIVPAALGSAVAVLTPDTKVYVLAVTFILAAVFGYIGISWGMAATTAATVDQTLGVKSALGHGWRMAPSFIWIMIIASIVIWGGTLLFIVPGVVFIVWVFATQFIIFAEEERGMGALLKSRAYVKGYCADTFVKLLMIFLCTFAAGFVPFGQIVFFPFMLIFLHEMYRDLRRVKGPVLIYNDNAGAKALWLGTGVLGLVLLVALIVLLSPTIKSTFEKLKAGDIRIEESSSYKRPAPYESSPPNEGAVRPHEYERIIGAWSGRGPDGSSGWHFVFTTDYQVVFTAPNGKNVVSDASEVFIDLGTEPGADSANVPPGASLIDLRILSADTGRDIGKISLGVYRIESGGQMTLCLSRPGVHVRATEYRSSNDISCFELDSVSTQASVPPTDESIIPRA